MGKLHELLAVEEDRKGKANKIVKEGISTFKNKDQHFMEQIIVFKPIEENEKEVQEGHVSMADTVKNKVNYVTKSLAQYFDVFIQKEMANTKAKNDIILADGTVFQKDVPATALLALEKELAKAMDFYNTIPTLEGGTPWTPASDRGEGIVMTSGTRRRTKKITKPVVMYEATKEHPAQVKEVSEDILTGTIETTTYSSKLTTSEKSDILERLDNLKTATKKARMRANTCDAPSVNIGKKIFGYINNGTIQ